MSSYGVSLRDGGAFADYSEDDRASADTDGVAGSDYSTDSRNFARWGDDSIGYDPFLGHPRTGSRYSESGLLGGVAMRNEQASLARAVAEPCAAVTALAALSTGYIVLAVMWTMTCLHTPEMAAANLRERAWWESLGSWRGGRGTALSVNLFVISSVAALAPITSCWVCGTGKKCQTLAVSISILLVGALSNALYFFQVSNTVVWLVLNSLCVLALLMQAGWLLWNLDKTRPLLRVLGSTLLAWELSWILLTMCMGTPKTRPLVGFLELPVETKLLWRVFAWPLVEITLTIVMREAADGAYRAAAAAPGANAHAQATLQIIPSYVVPILSRASISGLVNPWAVAVAAGVDGLLKVVVRLLGPATMRKVLAVRLGSAKEADATVDSPDWKAFQAQRLVAVDVADRFWIMMTVVFLVCYQQVFFSDCDGLSPITLGALIQLAIDTAAVAASYFIVSTQHDWPVMYEAYAALRSPSLLRYWALFLGSMVLWFPFVSLTSLSMFQFHSASVAGNLTCGIPVQLSDTCFPAGFNGTAGVMEFRP